MGLLRLADRLKVTCFDYFFQVRNSFAGFPLPYHSRPRYSIFVAGFEFLLSQVPMRVPPPPLHTRYMVLELSARMRPRNGTTWYSVKAYATATDINSPRQPQQDSPPPHGIRFRSSSYNALIVVRRLKSHLPNRVFLDVYIYIRLSFPAMHLPLCLCNAHKKIFILNGNPTGKHLHGVLKVRVQEDSASAIDECS
jgi:hypothetical protein